MARPEPGRRSASCPPGIVPRGHDRARHRHHQGRPDRGRHRAVRRAVLATASSPTRERRYVRNRPETFAGRWAAKEAVSKVLGPGRPRRRLDATSRSSGCRRASRRVRLHGRAAAARRAAGDGPDRRLDQPRVRVRRRRGLRRADGGRAVRVPARHRRRGSTTGSGSCSARFERMRELHERDAGAGGRGRRTPGRRSDGRG